MLRTLDGGMLVYGHRGAPLDEAENNWKGYVRAADHGAHGIEGDVAARVKDRFGNWHLVNFHDDTKDRVTDQTGRLDETTLEETQELRVTHPRGKRGDAQSETGLPRWADLLRFVRAYPRHLKAFVELKGDPVEDELAQLLDPLGMASPASAEEARAWIISSNRDALQRMRRAAPNVPTSLVRGSGAGAIRNAIRASAWAITINILELRADPGIVERAHDAGLAVICACRTTNWAEVRAARRTGRGEIGLGESLRRDVEYCQSLGVDAISVNDAGRVVGWLEPKAAPPTPGTFTGVAAFDFDGTLAESDSWRPFLEETFKRRRVYKRWVGVVSHTRERDAIKVELIRRLFKDMPADELARRGEAYAKTLIPLLRPEMLKAIAWHKSQGHAVVINSASPAAYLRPLAENFNAYLRTRAVELGIDPELLRIDGVCGIELEVEEVNGRRILTGEIVGGKNNRGAQKVTSMDAWLTEHGLPLDIKRHSYGDSSGDDELKESSDYHTWVGGRAGRDLGDSLAQALSILGGLGFGEGRLLSASDWRTLRERCRRGRGAAGSF